MCSGEGAHAGAELSVTHPKLLQKAGALPVKVFQTCSISQNMFFWMPSGQRRVCALAAAVGVRCQQHSSKALG
jgi:hypothetical protein